MIARLHWRWLLAATVVTFVGIAVVAPNHIDLQTAEDADAFRALLDEPARHLAGAVIDMGFALAYGLLGILALDRIGGPTVAVRIGQALIGAGAVFDEIENVFLARNIVVRDSLTDGWVDTMQVPGALKALLVPGLVVLAVLAIARLLRHDGNPRP